MTSKEVLEYLKELSTYELFLDNIRIKEKTSRQIIKSAIYQLDKQQKEIEKLNFENHMVKKWNEQLDKNCISKDKIRERIEEYDKWIKQGEYIESLEAQKYALNELLKENQEDGDHIPRID